MTLQVGEFFATDYPTLEGGFTMEGDDLDAMLAELRREYAVVEEPTFSNRHGWRVRVYEHELS